MSATDKNGVLDRSKRPRSHINALKKRRSALKKKASELATLCDAKLCLVSYPPQGDEPEIWPENKSEVEEILTRFLQLSEADRAKKRSNPSKFSRNKETVLKEDPDTSTHPDYENPDTSTHPDYENPGASPRPDYYTWCPQLEKCSEKQLWEINDDLDAKLQILKRKIDRLAGKRPIDDNEMVSLFPSSNGCCDCDREVLVSNFHALNNTDQIEQSAIPLKQLPHSNSTCDDEDAIDCQLRLFSGARN